MNKGLLEKVINDNNERLFKRFNSNSSTNTRTQQEVDIYQDYMLYLLSKGLPQHITTEDEALKWIEARISGQIKSKYTPLEKSIEKIELDEDTHYKSYYTEEDSDIDYMYEIIEQLSESSKETLMVYLEHRKNGQRAKEIGITRQGYEKRLNKAIREAKTIYEREFY